MRLVRLHFNGSLLHKSERCSRKVMAEPTEKMKAASRTAKSYELGENLNKLLYHLAQKTKAPIATTTTIGVSKNVAIRWNVKEVLAQWNLVVNKKSLQIVIATNKAGDYSEVKEQYKFCVLLVIYQDRCVYQNVAHKAFNGAAYQTHETLFPESIKVFIEGEWIAELIDIVEIFEGYGEYLARKKEADRIAIIERNIKLKK